MNTTLIRPLTIACAAALVLCQSLAADVITISPSKDNSLHQQTNPGAQMSNGQGDIFIGRTGQDGQGPPTISIRRGLVAFDVAGSVPAGSTITGVSLTMRDVMGLNGNQTVNLHRATADWGEGSSFFGGGQGAPAQQNDATWLYRSYDFATPANSTPWSTPGGDFNSLVSAATVVSVGPPNQMFAWSSSSPGNSQMLLDVQNWLDNPAGNFGWVMRGNESAGQTAKRLSGGESTFPPALQITFEAAAVPEPASLTLFLLMAVVAVAAGMRARPRLFA